jgi:hypothetical protein
MRNLFRRHLCNGFNSVAVGIDEKCSVVVRAVVRPQAGFAIVLATDSQSALVEGIYRRPRRGRKCQVETGAGDSSAGPQFEAEQILAVLQPIAYRGRIFKHSAKTKRAQGCVVERARKFQISDSEGNMVEHRRTKACGQSALKADGTR